MSQKKKKLREAFRNAVFRRDGYTCKFCPATDNLDAHHITDREEMPNGGYVPENGISLCPADHKKAEVYHESEGRMWTNGMHPDDLYRLIDSSKELAYAKSERLNSAYL